MIDSSFNQDNLKPFCSRAAPVYGVPGKVLLATLRKQTMILNIKPGFVQPAERHQPL